jgi:hypothetical protein
VKLAHLVAGRLAEGTVWDIRQLDVAFEALPDSDRAGPGHDRAMGHGDKLRREIAVEKETQKAGIEGAPQSETEVRY